MNIQTDFFSLFLAFPPKPDKDGHQAADETDRRCRSRRHQGLVLIIHMSPISLPMMCDALSGDLFSMPQLPGICSTAFFAGRVSLATITQAYWVSTTYFNQACEASQDVRIVAKSSRDSLLTCFLSQEVKIEAYFGRKVAVDASMSIYQFLIAMQRPDGTNMLTNDSGEVTSHINGLMHRTTKMLECGIKPVFVFDGKPPELKKGTLDDRREKREEADAALAKAKEENDQEAVEKVNELNLTRDKRSAWITFQYSIVTDRCDRYRIVRTLERRCQPLASWRCDSHPFPAPALLTSFFSRLVVRKANSACLEGND